MVFINSQKSADKLAGENPLNQQTYNSAEKINPEIGELSKPTEINNNDVCGSQGLSKCGKNSITPLPCIIQVQEVNNSKGENDHCILRNKKTEEESRGKSPEMDATYCNFLIARKMAQENLEHQPLPDAVMDCAYRKLQASGDLHPGLALDVIPLATGNLKISPKCVTNLVRKLLFLSLILFFTRDCRKKCCNVFFN